MKDYLLLFKIKVHYAIYFEFERQCSTNLLTPIL